MAGQPIADEEIILMKLIPVDRTQKPRDFPLRITRPSGYS